MNFITVGNVTQINGQAGSCDGKIKNADVKYGRNAAWNNFEYLNEMGFGTSEATKPSLNFDLKYLPEEQANAQNLNKMALLGAAFTDLGNKISMPLEQMNKIVKNAFGDKATAEAFDVNGDGQIDVGENAVAFILKDMADKTPTEQAIKDGALKLSADYIDGHITNVGENNFGAFINSQKVNENKQLISQIHQVFKLDEAKNIFASDPNNMA